MNVSLTPELEEIVLTKVRSGRYRSASEVVREAIRLMEAHDCRQALNRVEVVRKIEEGIQSAERGEIEDGDAVFPELLAELDDPMDLAAW